MSEVIRRSSLHIHGIRELPPDVDEDIARLFREMRRAVGGTAEEVADRLRAETTTVTALEQGAIRALPDWQETERVVSDYGALLSLDATPILDRLRSQLYPQRRPKSAVADSPSDQDAHADSADGVLKVPPLVSARDLPPDVSAEHGTLVGEATDASPGAGFDAEGELALQPYEGSDADMPVRSAPVLTRRRLAIGGALAGACVIAIFGWSVLSGGWMGSGGQVSGVSDQSTDRRSTSDDPRSRKADKLPVRGQGSSR